MKDVAEKLSIDVCVCTYRRESLAQTLSSLFELTLPSDWEVHILIADNDERPSAKHIVDKERYVSPFPVSYIHAPARNISVARNACLDAADATLVAFIDDDEVADPLWLQAMVTKQRESLADVVLGPVRSIYPEQAPSWLKRGDFHSIQPVWVDGEIITGYTSNVLFVREAPAIKGLRFDPRLGLSGGEDTLFFATVHKTGGQITYAPDAIVIEDVAPTRLNYHWLIKRYFRSGQTHGLLLLRNHNYSYLSRLSHLAVAASKALFCDAVALVCLATGGRARAWFLRGTLHAGVVARLLGWSELAQYG
jgi:succinoglycan biosynthesis protein ExoM